MIQKSESVGVRNIARIEVERCDRDPKNKLGGGVRVYETRQSQWTGFFEATAMWSDATALSAWCLPLSSHIYPVWHFLLPYSRP